MLCLPVKARWFLIVAVMALALPHTALLAGQEGRAGKEAADKPGPAEAIRKALDQAVTLDFTSQTLKEALDHLRDKTKINFITDQSLEQTGFFNNPMPVQLKVNNGKLRQALNNMLLPHNLSYVILGDAVVVTMEEMGVQLLMRQRIDVAVDNLPVGTALKNLARTHAVSLVIDPKMAKETQTPVTLHLEDVSLESTIRLLAEMGGLKSVRVGNVLFVTSEDKAKKMRKEDLQDMQNPYRLMPNMVGGFGAAPALARPPLPPPAPPARRVPPPAAPSALSVDPSR